MPKIVYHGDSNTNVERISRRVEQKVDDGQGNLTTSSVRYYMDGSENKPEDLQSYTDADLDTARKIDAALREIGSSVMPAPEKKETSTA